MKISIAIPAYEYSGNGWFFLSYLINSVIEQDYTDIEIVISDQSKTNDIKSIAIEYSKHIDINYINNPLSGMGCNFNNAVKHCTGDLIKIMCLDDYFVDSNALSKIANHMKSNANVGWLINGCIHAQSMNKFYDRMIPYYHEKIHLGANTISSPSVLTMRNKDYFDEKLVMLLDCEMYKRLYIKYGAPFVLEDPLICNRMHPAQAQKHNNEIVEEEKKYCIMKYGE